MGSDNSSKPESQPCSNQQQQQNPPPEAPSYEEPAFKLEPGRPDITYYWIDRRVYNAENQMCYSYFSKNFKMDIFTSIQGLRSTLQESGPGKVIKVLTAAGLPDEDFKYLHNEPKVVEVFLYCANEERAKLLMRNFQKIGGYGLRKDQVVQIMREAEKREPKIVVPITEQLIGKKAQGIDSSQKPSAHTLVSSNAQLASGNNNVNVNNSIVGVSLDPINPNVNQSSVVVNLNPPVGVNQSVVNVNLNPPVNVNQSNVMVNLNPNANVNQSSVVVNLDPPKPINVNNSTVQVVL